MTCSVRILTTFSLDSSPALLLVSPNGGTTLVNCGEGCQRSFLESPGLRTRSVTRICLTHIAHDAIGGLPGMVLTTADVAIAAAANMAQAKATPATAAKTSETTTTTSEKITPAKRKAEDVGGIDIVGPEGTQAFLHSLRHFMRRDKFTMRVKEGAYVQKPSDATPIRNKLNAKRKKGPAPVNPQGFFVQTIPLAHRWERKSPDESTIETQVLSFIFTTPPVPGKFLPDKAKELGIAPGPLYAQLKAGKSVTFTDDTGVERTVESHQVVASGSPGVAVAVIYCPSFHVLNQLKESSAWKQFEGKDAPVLDVVVHMSSHGLFHSQEYQSWMRTLPKGAEHIWLESVEFLMDLGDRIANAETQQSPFRSAALGALSRSLLHEELYPSPISLRPDGTSLSHRKDEVGKKSNSEPTIMYGKPMMEYKLIPRSKKGLVASSNETEQKDTDEATSAAVDSGAVELAKSIIAGFGDHRLDDNGDCSTGELLFTGTGSAIPCKQRNVTGMYLRMKNGNGMLLDVGESTLGQLLRAKKSGDTFQQLLQSIKAVWISHPHADHHLGLIRFLTERNSIQGFARDQVVLMAPPNMFAFLAEYSKLDPSMSGSYLPMDCRDMRPHAQNPLGERLHRDLGITHCISIPVAHCPHSYAVIFDGTPFGRVAYSGDCRPSMTFADAGLNADLLIHEATFEDGMEEEALLKKHCTVGEALMVARRMQAKAVALTHFSQRYPRIPPVQQGQNDGTIPADVQARGPSNAHEKHGPHVIFAFDFMKVTPRTLVEASALTPALRLLYPNEQEPKDEVTEPSFASEMLSVPGLFAQQEIL